MEDLELLEKEQKKEITEAIENNNLYDFVASNYWRLDNHILHALYMECIATLKEEQMKELLDNLKEYREWDNND